MGKWVGHYIKQLDIYGKTITFTYKGKEQYTTYLGGFMSIMIKLLILAFGVSILSNMINRRNTNSTVNRIVNDIVENTKVVDLQGTDFTFFLHAKYNFGQTSVNFTGSDQFFSLSASHAHRSGRRIYDNVTVTSTSISSEI